ncbi:MAG: lipocalin family protein [FCB group bacterium]|nr:lipocalin family protein [FCB group bacterium]
MKKRTKFILIVITVLGLFTMLAAAEKQEAQKLVDHVDLDRFMGDWYVIANIPTMFEKGAVNAIENYTWNPEKEIVEVSFDYRAGSPDGKAKHMTQKGFIYNKETNAEWRVQPLWPLKLGYLIIDLADDYSYTVIGVPNRKYLWIMARDSSLPYDVYQSILAKVKAQGYDLDKIQMVPQIWL